MAKRGPQPKTGKMEPPAYSLCERVPDPPESLSNVGRALWNEVASELHSRGILTFVSMAPLEIYCDAYACARELNEFIRENGCTYENDKGWQQPRPELMVATQKSKLMMSLAKEFGFTPGSQSRIAIVPEKGSEAVDPVEAAREALRRKFDEKGVKVR